MAQEQDILELDDMTADLLGGGGALRRKLPFLG